MDQWRTKVAIVTAASGQVGAEICRQLCANGLIVVGLTPNIDQLDVIGEEIRQTHEEAQFHAVQCDLGVEDEIQTAVDYVCGEFGGVDVLVHCSTGHGNQLLRGGGGEGGGVLMFLDEDGLDSVETAVRTNILGLISITKKVYQSMVERGSCGYIVNVSLVMEGASSICATVDTFATELAKELCLLEKPMIRVSNISAANVQLLDREEEGDEELRLDGVQVKDIADTVIYCLSSSANVQIKSIEIGSIGGSF